MSSLRHYDRNISIIFTGGGGGGGGGGLGLLTSLSGKKTAPYTAKPKTAIKPPASSVVNLIKPGSQTTVKQPKKPIDYSSMPDDYHRPHNPLMASVVGEYGRVDESRVNNNNHNSNRYNNHNAGNNLANMGSSHNGYGSSSDAGGISTSASTSMSAVNGGNSLAHTTGKKKRPMGMSIPTLSLIQQQQQQSQQQPLHQQQQPSHPLNSTNTVYMGIPASSSNSNIDSSSSSGQHAALSPRRPAVNPFSNLVLSTKTTTTNNNSNGKGTLSQPPLPQPSSSIPSSSLSTSTSSTSTSLQQPWLSQSTNYPTTTHPPKPTAVALSVSAAVSEAAAATGAPPCPSSIHSTLPARSCIGCF